MRLKQHLAYGEFVENGEPTQDWLDSKALDAAWQDHDLWQYLPGGVKAVVMDLANLNTPIMPRRIHEGYRGLRETLEGHRVLTGDQADALRAGMEVLARWAKLLEIKL